MIDYELAKQLKDAGFPQKKSGKRLLPDGMGVAFMSAELFKIAKEIVPELISIEEAEEHYVYAPTLSDLIDACGGNKGESYDKFALWFNGEDWSAGSIEYCSDGYIDDTPFDSGQGKTPEEAAANLWLELNK